MDETRRIRIEVTRGSQVQAKESWWVLEVGKGKEMDYLLESPERKAGPQISCSQPSEIHVGLLTYTLYIIKFLLSQATCLWQFVTTSK